jgi:hypothetical protein
MTGQKSFMDEVDARIPAADLEAEYFPVNPDFRGMGGILRRRPSAAAKPLDVPPPSPAAGGEREREGEGGG